MNTASKVRVDMDAGKSTPITFAMLDPDNDNKTLESKEVSTGSGTKRSYTFDSRPLLKTVRITEKGDYINTDKKEFGSYSSPSTPSSVRYGDNDVYLYFYPERQFKAFIPAGSGTTPVFLPGDVVPILVRSTTDFASGSKQTIKVTYNTANGTENATCSTVLGRYGNDEGQYSAVLFGWTVPDNCTGGQITLSEYKNDTQAVALEDESSQEPINKVNCNIDYSNRTASFKDASVKLVDATGTESADGDPALILPVRDNAIAWWEWIAGEANSAMQGGGKAPYQLSSMYATFGEAPEKHPVYVHTKNGTPTITVRGQKLTVDEVVDYVYVPVEGGRLSAVHLHYKGYDTSSSTVPNYSDDDSGFVDAYLNNHKLFFSVISGAANEYPVNEFNPETGADTKPEDQEYF